MGDTFPGGASWHFLVSY